MQIAILAFLSVAIASPVAVTPGWQNHVDLFTSKPKCSTAQETLSCGFKANATDSCCVENPGGLVLFTQLWNTDVTNGPSHQWTLHGSWPDNCDGSYGSFCDYENTSIESVESILREHKQDSLVDYMDQFWLNNNGTNDEFWVHEFNKHATCMSTIRPSCYEEYTPGQNVVDFFKMSVRQYHSLPTFTWLADAGIVPSSTQKYQAEDIQQALDTAFGYKVHVGCTNGTLDEVWYYHYAQGSLLSQNFVKTDTTFPSTCKGEVSYPPKQGQSFVLW